LKLIKKKKKMSAIFVKPSNIPPSLQMLKSQNYRALFAHLITLLILVVLYFTMPQTHALAKVDFYKYDIAGPNSGSCTSSGSSSPPGQCSVNPPYAPPQRLGSVNIIYGVWGFFLITILAHLFYATDAFGSGSYSNAVLNQGWNPYRWIEYALSASLMSLLIGLSTGSRDQNQVVSYVLATASLMAFGYIVENTLRVGANFQKATVIAATLGGWVSLLSMWIPLFLNFSYLVQGVKKKYKDERDPSGQRIEVPQWVYAIIFIQFLNFASFGFIQLRQIMAAFNGKPSSFPSVEGAYTTLSLAGKLALAAGIGYGILFRGRSCPR
jgi:hypothetical protein